MQWARWKTAGWIVGAVGLLLGAGAPAQDGPALSAERYVRYGFSVQNTTDQLLSEAELWVCTPLPLAAQQRLKEWKTSPAFTDERVDCLGNHLVRFSFRNLPPYAVSIVTVEATLEMGETQPSAVVDPAAWLKAEPLFEHTDEAFDQLAPAFAGDPPEQAAREIYDWVRGHVQDGPYDGTDRGARYALLNRKGDCTEFAALYVALCRRAGIPARGMGGYVVARNTTLNPATYHNWAEILLDGRWQVVDPHAGVFLDRQNQYVGVRILGVSDSPLENFSRFRYRGAGLKVVMNP